MMIHSPLSTATACCNPIFFTVRKCTVIFTMEHCRHDASICSPAISSVMPPAKRAPSGSPKLQDTVRLSAEGLAKVLGDLEARVLRAVWALGQPVTAREVHEHIVEDHAVSPLTTTTVLNRLVAKRVLKRTRKNDRLHFAPVLDQETFMRHVSRRVVEGVLSFGPDAVASSFVDILAERDPAKLEELAVLIKRKLRERKNT